MKKIMKLVLLGVLLLGCNTNEKKDSPPAMASESNTEPETQPVVSSDYSSILGSYTCDMTASEIAEVLQVPASAIQELDYGTPDKCYIELTGYGNSPTTLSWGNVDGSKNGNKKIIDQYLKNKKDNTAVMGMDIVLAETGDCHITYQPLGGRMMILNANYDKGFLMSYGTKNTSPGRTKEQHEELRLKMTDLANYLLKKHRK